MELSYAKDKQKEKDWKYSLTNYLLYYEQAVPEGSIKRFYRTFSL
jgi:hypothetical protein